MLYSEWHTNCKYPARTNFGTMHISLFKRNFTAILTIAFFLSLSLSVFSQSPKKYLKNGFYEQAFVEAAHKQNKKVKLKAKHADVIIASYPVIYEKHIEVIKSPQTTWLQSYNRFIRMTNFRARVKHPGVYDKLKNILYDEVVLDYLATKFNNSNLKDLNAAESFESTADYEKALDKYKEISTRHEQATPITTFADRLTIIDYEARLEKTNQKIGDQYILEAEELLERMSKQGAEAAIKLIEKARSHRPLDFEEEELLTLANLIISSSWISEAKKLIGTRTKKNARLAYELINRARSTRTLTAEEEKLFETAKSLGMTRIVVKVKGGKPIHDSQSLSGSLNRKKSSQWITYYDKNNGAETIDFEMEITESQPKVVLGDVRKKVTQNTKTVEYWVDETDVDGNTTRVRKTRLAIAMASIVSRTKTAHINWSIVLKDLSNSSAVYSESKESKVEYTNEFVSLASGDILALPENIESEVDLDSQPFPPNKDMINQVKSKYLGELNAYVNSSKDHLRNVNRTIKE
jgi:hypothetical protein